MREWRWPSGYSEADVPNFHGFIYEITDTGTGKLYVGKKSFRAKRGNRYVESNWQRYWGSCTPLLIDLKVYGYSRFTRHILSLHRSEATLRYAEEAELFKRDAMTAKLPDGSPAYYNTNICGRWFARNLHLAGQEAVERLFRRPVGPSNIG